MSHPHRPYLIRGIHQPRAAGTTSWSARALCAAYGWPSHLPGGGEIGILELGGAYRHEDTLAFCHANNIAAPNVQHVYVGGTKQTTMEDDASGEVALDVQIAAAAYTLATGKPADIRIFWAPDIEPGLHAAMQAAMDVFSISWGTDEANWGAAALKSMDAAAQTAVNEGMIITAASGDNDSSDGGDTPANVDGPASCPHVIGCGGTSKTRHDERVWNNNPGQADGSGTGGGYSTVFVPMPLWLAGAPHGPGRMVPDMAANADPETGYEVWVNGVEQVIGGTSAVAPLYAGFFAACGKKLGWVVPKMWVNHMAFNDIQVGDNGAYRARMGPDPCTGLGALIPGKLARLLVMPPK